MDGDFDIVEGTYINFEPFYATEFDSLENEIFYLSGRENGITGLAFLQISPTFSGDEQGYLYIEPQINSDGCSGKYSVAVYVTSDWERYKELQFQAIREGISNLVGWMRAGSG